VPKQRATRSDEGLSAFPGTDADSTPFALTTGSRLDQYLAPVVLAVSLNGFFLYLGSLALVNIAPRTRLTFCWYAVVGVVCVATTILYRSVLVSRLRANSRVVGAALTAAIVLAAWFELNALFIGRTSLAEHFAALLVLSSLPTAVLALSTPRRLFEQTARLIGALGLVFLVIEVARLNRLSGDVQRFSPIPHLDPISAGGYAALGAVCIVSLRPSGLRAGIVQAVLAAALIAGSTTVGSRGPVLAAGVGCVAAAIIGRRPTRLIAIAALVAGILIGTVAARSTGTYAYLTNSVGGGTSSAEPISTFHIRLEWLRSAFEQAPERPLFGHGVAQFVDETPEAHRMGVAGQKIYPHNELAEAAFSLGILGLIPYLVLIATTIIASVELGLTRSTVARIAGGLVAFAAVSTSVSGEIGADVIVWTAAALVIGAYADRSLISLRPEAGG
jgi:O-antigen ligase